MTEADALTLLAASYEAVVSRRNRVCRFDEYTERHLKRVAAILCRPSSKFGIIMGGTFGNGKTTMMYAIQKAVSVIDELGYFKRFMPARWRPHFEIHEAVDFEEIIKDRQQFKRVANIEILGIDDLGAQQNKVFDWGNVVEPIKRLLEHRYKHQLYTIITTNQTRAEMSRDINDGRIDDRMEEMFHRIGFSSEISYRRLNED